MKKHQQGFTAIGALVILVVFAVVGGIGWYVWQLNESNKNNTDPTKTSQTDSSNKDDSSLLFTHIIPTDWDSEVFNDGDMYSVTLRAPGTKSEGEAYTEVVQGAEVYLNCVQTAYSDLEEFKKEDDLYAKNSTDKQELVINQAKAVQYVVDYEGPRKRVTTFFVGSESCDVSIEENVYKKQEFSKAYDQIVESIKF